MLGQLNIALRNMRIRTTRRILSHRVQARFPTLVCDPTAIWDYGFHDLDAVIDLGQHVFVGPYAEIVVYRQVKYSRVEGRLTMGQRAAIMTGANVRAAGGAIRIGDGSVISQHSVLVAANHGVAPGKKYFYSDWDETRTGITIGDNVWVAAQCVVLPGVTIGNDAVIAAGSVVTRNVPAGEIWGGVPARRIRAVADARPGDATAGHAVNAFVDAIAPGREDAHRA